MPYFSCDSNGGNLGRFLWANQFAIGKTVFPGFVRFLPLTPPPRSRAFF